LDQQLAAFLMVVDQRNFTRAAEALHTTQPAVSQNIRNLERRLGTKLLERNNKYVRLNKAGEIVYHHAKEIMAQYTKMERLVEDVLTSASGALPIGSSYTFGEYVLPHVIAGFRAAYPHIQPSIAISNTREVIHLISAGALDVGIIEGNYADPAVSIDAFAEDTVHVVAAPSHPLAGRQHIRLEDIASETWIVREQGSGTREIAEVIFERLRFQPATLLEFASTQMIKESVEAGLGIAVLSQWAIRKEITLGTLVTLPLTKEPVTRKFSVVTRTSEFQTKATQLFRAYVMEHPVDSFAHSLPHIHGHDVSVQATRP